MSSSVSSFRPAASRWDGERFLPREATRGLLSARGKPGRWCDLATMLSFVCDVFRRLWEWVIWVFCKGLFDMVACVGGGCGSYQCPWLLRRWVVPSGPIWSLLDSVIRVVRCTACGPASQRSGWVMRCGVASRDRGIGGRLAPPTTLSRQRNLLGGCVQFLDARRAAQKCRWPCWLASR